MKIWAILRTLLLLVGAYYALKFIFRWFNAKKSNPAPGSGNRKQSNPRNRTIELRPKGKQFDKDGNEIIEYGE